MIFSSPFFLFLYFPIVLLLYYISPLKWRNLVLLAVNLVFYGWGEPVYVVIMFVSIAIDYSHGRIVTRCKAKGNDRGARMAVASSVVFNLALLGFFKYWDFIVGNLNAVGLDLVTRSEIRSAINAALVNAGLKPLFETVSSTLPIGISFYTFQTMSYTIDVYRGDARCQKDIVTFGTFVTLFPQLIAGPIIKYKDLDGQLERRDHTFQKFASGVQRFTIGACKKVLLANALGPLWDVYLATPSARLTTLGAWLGIVAFSLQLYFDFSGYSDMAIGLGRMLGFEFLENFNYPYISKSASEFWRRWHISLGSWFREYLYFPLGGSRVGKGRMVFNLLVVWAATGIWHGASWNFLFWGLYWFVWITLEKLWLGRILDKAPAWACHVYGVLVAVVGWAIFAVEDFSAMGPYLAAMFGFGAGALDTDFLYYLRNYLPILMIAVTAATPLGKNLWHRLPDRARQVAFPVLMTAGLVFTTAYLVDGTYNPFLYFRF